MNPVFRMASFGCERITKANGTYLYCLKARGLAPFEDSFKEQSFLTIVDKASEFQSHRLETCGMRWCDCFKLNNIDLKVELQQGIEKCHKLEPGLCLLCIKTKGKSSKEGSCQCVHP